MSRTVHLRADRPVDVQEAAALLQRGGLVAFATETVYGLGANALSAGAVSEVFKAKGRPAWDPLIVHVPDLARVHEIASITGQVAERVQTLAEAFWPGPMTLLLPRAKNVPGVITAGRNLVGVRVPVHPAAQALLRAAGLPVAAPSANRFGHISPTTAQHVLNDLDGRIDAVLDAGPCPVGLESTVLDPAPTPMVMYRAGAVTAKAMERACRVPVLPYETSAGVGANGPEGLPSPGVGIRHYAPDADLRLTGGTPEALWFEARALPPAMRVGLLLPEDWADNRGVPSDLIVEPWGRWTDPDGLAAGLFAGLRMLEARGAKVILCPLPEPGGLRDALRDRLGKAARSR